MLFRTNQPTVSWEILLLWHSSKGHLRNYRGGLSVYPRNVDRGVSAKTIAQRVPVAAIAGVAPGVQQLGYGGDIRTMSGCCLCIHARLPAMSRQ